MKLVSLLMANAVGVDGVFPLSSEEGKPLPIRHPTDTHALHMRYVITAKMDNIDRTFSSDTSRNSLLVLSLAIILQ